MKGIGDKQASEIGGMDGIKAGVSTAKSNTMSKSVPGIESLSNDPPLVL